MSTPRVSIVLPVLDGSRHLPDAVESVRSQTLDAWELIICDDGSTDGSLELARRFAEEDPRIRVVPYPGGDHHGPAAARNRGLEDASADAVAFLDADDTWVPRKLERQLQAFDEHPSLGLVYARARCIDDEGRPIPADPERPRSGVVGNGRPGVPTDAFADLLSFRHRAPTSTVIASAPVLRSLGGFDEDFRHGQDRLMWIRVARDHPVLFLPEILGGFRIHPDSHSTALSRFRRTHLQVDLAVALARESGRADGPIRHRARRALTLCLMHREASAAARGRHLLRAVRTLWRSPQFGPRTILVLGGTVLEVARLLAGKTRRAPRAPGS